MAVFGLTQIASAGLCVLWSTKYLRYLAPYFGGYSENGGGVRVFRNLQIRHGYFSAAFPAELIITLNYIGFFRAAALLSPFARSQFRPQPRQQLPLSYFVPEMLSRRLQIAFTRGWRACFFVRRE